MNALDKQRNAQGDAQIHKSARRSCAVHASVCVALVLRLSGAAADADGWPMFRGSQTLVGVASGSLPAKMDRLWTFKTAGPVKSSAAIAQNRVYIGSNDSNVYALNLADGQRIWAFRTGGAVESSPLFLADKVFVGSSDAFLYALEAATEGR